MVIHYYTRDAHRAAHHTRDKKIWGNNKESLFVKFLNCKLPTNHLIKIE